MSGRTFTKPDSEHDAGIIKRKLRKAGQSVIRADCGAVV
jgi:hypothetical protein